MKIDPKTMKPLIDPKTGKQLPPPKKAGKEDK